MKLQKFQFIKKGVNMNKFNKMLDDNMFFTKSFLKKAAFWMYALFFMAMLLIFKWHWLTAYFMIIYI